MKKLTVLLAVVFALLAGSAFAQEKTYINGIDADYPPFGYVDATGKPSGFDVESMNWIANKMGFKVEHRPLEWDGIIPALMAKKIDMVCSGMSITEERKKQVAFSDPYWVAKRVFVVKNGSDIKLDDIYTKKIIIGTQMGTSEADAFVSEKEEKKYPCEVRFYNTGPMAVEDLLNGRIQAVLLEDLPANDLIAKGKAINIIGQFGADNEFGVAMRKDDLELIKTVNEGYKLLKADPYWQELQDKYLKKEK